MREEKHIDYYTGMAQLSIHQKTVMINATNNLMYTCIQVFISLSDGVLARLRFSDGGVLAFFSILNIF